MWVDSFLVICVDNSLVGEAQVGAQVKEVKGTVNSGRTISNYCDLLIRLTAGNVQLGKRV